MAYISIKEQEALQTMSWVGQDIDWLQFSPDSTLLVASSGPGPLHIWDRQYQHISQSFFLDRTRSTMPLHPEIAALMFAPRNVLYVAHYLGNTREIVPIWRSDTETNVLLSNHEGGATGVAFVPGEEWVVTTDMAQHIRLWDLSSWQPVSFWITQEGTPREGIPFSDLLCISPQGTYCARCADEQGKHLQLWLFHTRNPFLELLKVQRSPAPIQQLIFSPDEKLLACVIEQPSSGPHGYHNSLCLYALPTLELITQIHLPPDGDWQGLFIRRCVFSPDSHCLALTTADSRLWIWERAHRIFEVSLQAHLTYAGRGAPFFGIGGIAWSPDGMSLATGGLCSTSPQCIFQVKLWQVSSKKDFS